MDEPEAVLPSNDKSSVSSAGSSSLTARARALLELSHEDFLMTVAEDGSVLEVFASLCASLEGLQQEKKTDEDLTRGPGERLSEGQDIPRPATS